jgi:uncharacterized protein (DUF305 family)
MIRRLAEAAALVVLASTAQADTAAPAGGMMMMSAPAGASDATKGFVDAMNAMSMGMDQPFTGNPDVDFIAGMIPHHQGAVDAAKIELRYGTDPDARAFAQKVIAAQETEIAWMKDWLAKHGH